MHKFLSTISPLNIQKIQKHKFFPLDLLMMESNTWYYMVSIPFNFSLY